MSRRRRGVIVGTASVVAAAVTAAAAPRRGHGSHRGHRGHHRLELSILDDWSLVFDLHFEKPRAADPTLIKKTLATFAIQAEKI